MKHYSRIGSLLQYIFVFVILLSTISLSAQQVKYSSPWSQPGLSLQSQSPNQVELTFSIDEFSMVPMEIDGSNMLNIELPGVFLPNDEGMPNLPGMSRYIAIPQGSKAVLNIKASRIERIQNVDIAPAPRIPLETETGPLFYKKNAETYASNAFFPAEPIKLSAPSKIRGTDVVMVGVTPFQYNPVTKELIVYRDLQLSVEFRGGNGQFGEERLRSRWFDPILMDAVLNYESLPVVDYGARTRSLNGKDAGCEYLIVTPTGPEFLQWADTIKKFRTEQGILTDIKTVQELGGNNPTTLKNYFANAYNTWDIPPVAVLLLGDYGTNVANSITSPIWDSYCVSDNILADVDNDDMPEIVFARITANNAAQLQVMISKFLKYERNPPTSPDFYAHPITALGWQTERWFQICSEVVGGYFKHEHGKEPVRVNAIYQGTPGTTWSTATNTATVVNYFGPNGLQYIPQTPAELGGWTGGNATMVNNAINAGAFMLQHRDHGMETGWGEPAYVNSNINSLTNTDLTFVFSVNCLTGKYNYSSESFAEKFHRYTYNGQNSGALGLLAASEVSYSFVNDAFTWGMYDNMFPDFMPAYGMPIQERDFLPAFGNASGKYFLQQSAWPYNTGNKEVTYHLFHHHGDAFLNVYSEVPQNMMVSVNPILYAGATEFSIQAPEGAFVALTVDGTIIGTATATGTPQNITIAPQVPPSIVKLVITKQNYYRYEQNIEVIPPSGAYVVRDSYIINDLNGNGNGQADYGENLLLTLVMKNVGVAVAPNVNVTISTTDEYVTITDNTANYGNIDPNSTGTVTDGFALTIVNNIPDQHSITIQVDATDGSSTWTSYIGFYGNAPVLEVGMVSIADPTGNNNGRLDPGENAIISIVTGNEGHADAMSTLGILTSNTFFVTINSQNGNLGNIAPGATATATFDVTVDPATPIGTSVDFSYNATAGEYTASKDFALKVGLIVEDFETGNFSSYPWQFAGNANWTIVNTGAWEGTYAAKTGTIAHSQNSEMKVTLDVAAPDTISFYYKVSSESGYDFLEFYIDNTKKEDWSGEAGWARAAYAVTAGTHTFRWRYVKDYSVTGGSDAAWVDFISFPAVVDNTLSVFAGPDGSVCVGSVYNTNATGNAYSAVQWTTSGTGTFANPGALLTTYTPSEADYNAGSVVLTVTATGTSGGSVSDNLTLTFMPMPQVPGSPSGDLNICQNIVSAYTTAGAAGATSYLWMLNPPSAGTITGTSTTIDIDWDDNFTGTVSLAVCGMNSCGQSAASSPIFINISPTPAPAAAISGEAEVCQGGTDQYSTQVITNANSYMWALEPAIAGSLVSDGTDCYITWNNLYTGAATLSVCGVNDCGEGIHSPVFDIIVMNCTGINESAVNQLSVTPNPSNGTFNITITAHDVVTIRLIDQTGRSVYTENNVTVDGIYHKTVNAGQLPEALYYLVIEGNTTRSVQKVIIRY